MENNNGCRSYRVKITDRFRWIQKRFRGLNISNYRFYVYSLAVSNTAGGRGGGLDLAFLLQMLLYVHRDLKDY